MKLWKIENLCLGSNGSRKTEIVVQNGVYQQHFVPQCVHSSSVLQTQKGCNASCLNTVGIEFESRRG